MLPDGLYNASANKLHEGEFHSLYLKRWQSPNRPGTKLINKSDIPVLLMRHEFVFWLKGGLPNK